MIIYLLKSATCLALLLFFYHFMLEKEKMHNFNRFHLLGSVFFSFLAPLTTFTTYVKPVVVNTVPKTIEDSFFVENTTPILIEESINFSQIILGIYLFIFAMLLFRFGRNLFKIIRKIGQNEKVNHGKATLVLVNDKILPHTFWNFIFINKNDFNDGKIEAELFTHELTHVTQKHTFDVLFIELLQAIFWINPLFIFLKKAIQLNHEFLADEKVINLYKNPFQYQHLLLNKAAWNNEYYLASNLNYSLTKKRLEMMTTQSSKTIIWLKKLAVMPLLAAFIFLFAERVEAQKVIVEEKEEPIETIYEQAVSKKKNKIETIYEQAYTNQDKKIETGFTKIKKQNYYYVKVDNNTKYYNKDGKLTNSSGKILSNRRAKASSVLPDNYITKTFYNGTVFCEFFDDKPELRIQLNKVLRELLKTSDKKNKSLKESNDKSKLDKKYIDSPIPSNSSSKQFIPKKLQFEPEESTKLEDLNTLKDSYLNDTIPQKPIASKKQMQEYKTLLTAGKKNNIYKQKNIVKMQNIYNSMSATQKKSVENVFEIVPPPPKPDWVYTYQRLASKVKRTDDNRKANLIYLKEIYNNKMSNKPELCNR
ncbi:M56 family metallopeptidase [Polaribacter batillariae]|uniref:M56 family metallopeptidase n=1 Tax=Polaribacter batillariae TaxID=2808900 RepID=A0ABX7SZD0_9FLAO|nr:M56 family metallopeptidase [Polaribacter batillariae]QTD38871.1 M56 family metallopeptidase [Polaribacter batillariae]